MNMNPESIFVSAVRDFLTLMPRKNIIDWAEDNIDFSDDISAERKRLDMSLSPFLVDPLKCWEYSGRIREVVVCAPEQTGKTMIERIGVLYCMMFKPSSMMCVYPSDDLAQDVNKIGYEPLMRKIPQLNEELQRPYAKKKDCYILGASTMFFQGAGAKIMSKSCKIVVLDEEDQYPVVKTLDAVADTRKRTRSYSESIMFRVCTPTEKTGSIWRAFLAGSQGFWTLRCRKCGELTMRSCDFGNLQFDSTYDDDRGLYMVKPNSIRLICPKCKHEHAEKDKRWMNLNGGYIHQFPERLDLRPSFQYGVLATQFPIMSWPRIAEKILECGKRSDVKAHYELDNSWKGLPYTPREVSADDCRHLQDHMFRADQLPSADEIEMVFVVSDTQDDFSPTGLFALDIHDNLWLLDYANITHLWLSAADREELERKTGEKVRTVEDVYNTEVKFGDVKIAPRFHLLDYRGHRQKEVALYAANHSMVFLYAGAGTRQLEPFKRSNKSSRLYYVNAHMYQKQLIWLLYRHRNKEGDYLYLTEKLDPKFQTEIVCVQPDRTTKSGHLPENWKPEHDAVHDCFDVCKMACFAKDFVQQKFSPEMFRIQKSPGLRRVRKSWFEQREQKDAEQK